MSRRIPNLAIRALLVVCFLAPLNVVRADEETIRIGILAALEGPFRSLGEAAIQGATLALEEFGGEAGGKTVEPVIESTDGSTATATAKARSLLASGDVELIVGPLSGLEAVALAEFAATVPEATFVNGAAASPGLTRISSGGNFFSFSSDSGQWIAGLGYYAFDNKAYAHVVAVVEDYSFPQSQLTRFRRELCERGGRIVAVHRVAPGTRDLSDIAKSVAPIAADAVFLAVDSRAARSFLEHYWERGGRAPLLAGATTLDYNLLSSDGDFRPLLLGALTAAPIAEDSDTLAWRDFGARFAERFDGAEPGIFSLAYYVNTKALLLALEEIDSDLEDGHEALRKELAALAFESPTGPVRLDENHQVNANTYILEVVENGDGDLHNKIVTIVPEVGQMAPASENCR